MDNIRYDLVSNNIEELLKKTAQHFKVRLKDVRWYHIQNWVALSDDLIIAPYDFKNVLGKIMSGSVCYFEGYYMISYNSNAELISSRRMKFSICHEIYHYLYHCKNELIEKRTFNDLISSNGYDSSELIYEEEANLGASMMMMNDAALYHLLSEEYRFAELVHNFECSISALRVRLHTYLIYKIGYANYRYVWDIIDKFQNDKIKLHKQIVQDQMYR